MMGQEAVVIVEGLQQTVAAESIVQGDLVSLKAGDVVPADMRLIENHGLVVEESILTGESEPVKKTEHVITENSIIGDQKNMVFWYTCSKWVSYRCGSSNWRRDRNR